MIITPQTRLYTQDLKIMTGKDRNRLNGSNFYLIRDAWKVLLYMTPEFDNTTHQLGQIIDNGDSTCTSEVVPIIEAPIEDRRASMQCTNWQFRKAINTLELRSSVNSILNQDADAKDAWDAAGYFERNHPLVISFGIALGLSETEIDDLFDLAVTL